MTGNVYVTSRGRYCPEHPELTYLSATAAQLSLPGRTYGLDVLVRIGYQRDYLGLSFPQIQANLPGHIRVSERHLRALYQEYKTLLACAERLDVEKLKQAAAKYGGLILSIDGLEPEGGQPQLWVVREVLTNTILATGWLPRVDEDTLVKFLSPVEALDLPWLAMVSDKQAGLVKALAKTWDKLPHQYCQAHYLGNATKSLYEADGRMKTQVCKRIRKKAGVTMRQVQAEAKQKQTDKSTGLMVTGMAVSPPEGLAEVKAIAQAAQNGQSQSAVSATPVPSTPEVAAAPQTIEEVKTALEGSQVVVVVREGRGQQKQAPAVAQPDPNPASADRQQLVDELVTSYAARLRSAMSRSGRKPFRLAGLRLYTDLLALLTSLENSLTHLPDEPRLTCFAEAIREALLLFEQEYITIAEGYTWVLDISDILDVPLPEAGAKPLDKSLSGIVEAKLDKYLTGLEQRSDLNPTLVAFHQHLCALTKRYAPGLFHCYDIPGLPRTNNDMESFFGRLRRLTNRTSGRQAKQRLHEQGAWLLFDLVEDECEQVQRLQRVPLTEWRNERQRMQAHLATFTADRRFRRQPATYLAELETQAAEIATMP